MRCSGSRLTSGQAALTRGVKDVHLIINGATKRQPLGRYKRASKGSKACLPNTGATMIVKFNERFNLPVEDLYSHFHTPADWTRVFGFRGDSKELGDGWYSVSLKNFPFPLIAKNIEQEPGKLVRWVFRGFWRGKGEVRFEEATDGVAITGFEEVSVRPLFFLSPLFEKLLLERGFRAIWNVGWHRLRKIEASRGAAEAQ